MVCILSSFCLFLLSFILVHRVISLVSPLVRFQPLKTRVLLAHTSATTLTSVVTKPSTTMSKTGNKGPTYEAEEISYDILRPSGHVLEGTLTVPKDSPKVGPVIIFLHGTHSNRNHNFVPELCTKLVKDHGIRSYRFDFRVGPTTAEPDHRYKFSGYRDDLDDLECVVQSLVQAGYTVCGIFGHSRGANDALLYASSRLISVGKEEDDDRACATTVFQSMTLQASASELTASSSSSSASLTDDMQKVRLHPSSTTHDGSVSNSGIALETSASNAHTPSCDSIILNPTKLMIIVAAPRFNMPNMLTSLFSPEKLEKLATEGEFVWNEELNTVVTQADADVVCHKMDMVHTLSLIPSTVPMLLLHGTEDELIPLADAESYKSHRPDIELMIVEGARHAFRGKKQLKLLLTKCSEWIGTQYKAQSMM